MKNVLFEKVSKKGFVPQHVAEIGVYHPETSHVIEFIKRSIRCTLVEPDPKSIQRIKDYFSDYDNIALHQVAIYDHSGQIELVHRNASTFVSIITNSPAIINDDYQLKENDTFVVESITFDKIDDGTIDLLSVDIEGSEWYVLKHMISRPKIISLETHGSIYVNPFLDKIMSWMKNHDYEIWYRTGSDTVFTQKGEIRVSVLDKTKLSLKNTSIALRRFRKRSIKQIVNILRGRKKMNKSSHNA